MAIKSKLFYVIAWLFWVTFEPELFADQPPELPEQVSSEAVTSIRLRIGQHHRLKLAYGRQLKLSRRGVVDLVYNDKHGFWTILALRAGSVSLRVLLRDEVEAYYYIEVQKKANAKRITQIFADADRQAFICNHRGVNCQPSRYLVQGESSSLGWYVKARKLCDQAKLCVFQVQASEQLFLELSQIILDFDDSLSLQRFQYGRLLLLQDCSRPVRASRKQLAAFLDWPIDSLHVKCRDEVDQFVLMVTARLVRAHDQQARQWLPFDLWWRTTNIDGSHLAGLELRSDRSENRLLGQPRVVLAVGSEAEIQHGLELKFETRSDEIQAFFRRVGLQSKLSLLEHRHRSLRVRLQVGLSQPLAGLSRISSSDLTTELWLPIDEDYHIGELQLNIEDWSEVSHSLLASVPLIGPLFQKNFQLDGKARLVISLRAMDVQTSLQQ